MFKFVFQTKNKMNSIVHLLKTKLKLEYEYEISKKYQTFEFVSVKKIYKRTNKNSFLKKKNSWLPLFPDVKVKIKKPKFLYKDKNNKHFLLEKNSAYSLNDLANKTLVTGSILTNLENVKIINGTLLILIEKNLALVEGYGDLHWANFKLNKWPNAHHYPSARIKYYKKPIINKKIKLYRANDKIKKIKKGIYLSTRNDDQVYHWIFDNLSRLYCIDKISKLKTYPLIIKNQLSKFQKRTLKLLGIKNKIIYEKNYDIEVKKLIFPSIPSPPVLNKYTLNWLRNKFLLNIKKNHLFKKTNFPKKIFISRNDSNHRKIINENELSEKLQNIGYKIINLSKLKVEHQILLFNNADKIILPHGAAGIHLLFIKKNTKIFEIQSPDQLNNSLYLISKNFGGNHKIAIGKDPVDDYKKNYFIDVDKIIKNIE